MNFQQSSERESQVSHFLGQVYQEETSGFWGLECLESEWTGVLLKYIIKHFSYILVVYVIMKPKTYSLMYILMAIYNM